MALAVLMHSSPGCEFECLRPPDDIPASAHAHTVIDTLPHGTYCNLLCSVCHPARARPVESRCHSGHHWEGDEMEEARWQNPRLLLDQRTPMRDGVELSTDVYLPGAGS